MGCICFAHGTDVNLGKTQDGLRRVDVVMAVRHQVLLSGN